MKSTRTYNVIHAVPGLAVALITAFLMAGCFMPQDTAPGSLSMNAVSSARSLTTYDVTAPVWVVGAVIDSSFESQLKDLLAQDDYRKYGPGSSAVTPEIKQLWKDVAFKSAIRFEGGRPFFQFQMPRIDPGATFPVNDAFTIQGIPANRSYFLYLIVLDKEVTNIESFTDYDSLEAISPVHYYDPDVSDSDVSRSFGGTSITLPAGWYSFKEWVPTYSDSTTRDFLSATVWTDADGVPISSQPFTVSPGESVEVQTLLVDYDDGGV